MSSTIYRINTFLLWLSLYSPISQKWYRPSRPFWIILSYHYWRIRVSCALFSPVTQAEKLSGPSHIPFFQLTVIFAFLDQLCANWLLLASYLHHRRLIMIKTMLKMLIEHLVSPDTVRKRKKKTTTKFDFDQYAFQPITRTLIIKSQPNDNISGENSY